MEDIQLRENRWVIADLHGKGGGVRTVAVPLWVKLAPLFHNEQVTLLTDGVVEARNKSGELFGFERTQSISGESADSIANTAQRFGQDDDITVLSFCLA